VWLPKVMKNFEENYNVSKKIIITKDILKKEEGVYYIPACMLSFIDI
jgi:hypothetical protein